MNLGWIPPCDRDVEQHEAHDKAVGAMPAFKVYGAEDNTVKKIVLTGLWRHPLVKEALGHEFTRFHQLTGSCVGAGGGNAIFSVVCVEAIKLGEAEQIVMPFWPSPYGQSRRRAGMRGRGEGSLGSTFADAVRDQGTPQAAFPGLPDFVENDGLVLTKNLEFQWSDGNAQPSNVAEEAKKHPIKTTALCRDADAVAQAIRNYYPCTNACSYFVNQGGIRGVGAGAHVYGNLDSRGGHQTSIQGWWDHPEFGELFLYQNQWPASVYPRDPDPDVAPCSVWISKKTMNQICSEGETFAFSQYDGYPAQQLHWRI